MAVELRCPECRAKLRLVADPEPGTDVECPKCSNVFPAPDPDTGEVPDVRGKKKSRGDRPKKKPVADDDAGAEEKPAATAAPAATAEKPKTEAKPFKRKKRRAKKHKSNPAVLWAVIIGAIVFVGLLSGLLIWFFTKKPISYDMMGYLPADTDSAHGLNVGHLQKYPEFFKNTQNGYGNLGFIKAASEFAKAQGIAGLNDNLDYVMYGTGKSGSSLILRTKNDYEPGVLAKLPGAREQTLDGQKYYLADHYSGKGGRVKVFAPTKRLVVFCDEAMSDTTFRQILKGNKDNDKSFPNRIGPLGKRVTRGTYWYLVLFESADLRPVAPQATTDGGQEQQGAAIQRQLSEVTGSVKGMGFKASLGSRDVRVEYVLWAKDAEAATSQYKRNYKDTDLVKGDEVDPPKWWKDMLTEYVGDRKVGIELFSNLGAKSSGELCILYSSVETKTLLASIGSLVSRRTGQGGGQLGGPGPTGPGPTGPPGPSGGGKAP